MNQIPELIITPVGALDAEERAEIVQICTAAFDQDFATLFVVVPPTTMHIRAFDAGRLVGHACWSPRLLQLGPLPPLHTAYVDAVATARAYQGRGIGSAVLARLAEETAYYQLRALSTARPSFYARLGWHRWRGRIAVRTPDGLLDTPDETVMILPTHFTPALDLDRLLTAEPRDGAPW